MDAITRKLENAIATFDHKESTRRGYNPYALAQYLAALDEVADMVARGKPIRAALSECFQDRILTALLRAID